MCYTCLIIVLFFTTNCFAKIAINITVASARGGVKVKFNGFDTKLVTDKEINTFNITDENLKRGVRIEFGVTPNDVYLKDPTPHGNLYQKYKWAQVRRKLYIKRIEIQDIMNENVELAVHDYINNTTGKSKVPINVFDTVENTVKSFWIDKGLPNDEIHYNITIDFNPKTFSFIKKWRSNSTKTATTKIGVRNSGFVKVPPGKTITIKLKAKKTILLFKVTYVAHLMGNLIASYQRLLGKYHFWSPLIAAIMKTAKLNNKVITTEMVEIKCHTDPVLDVFDKTSGEKIPILFASRPFRKRKPKI